MEICPFWSSVNESFECSAECPFTISKNKDLEDCPFKFVEEVSSTKIIDFEDEIDNEVNFNL